MASFLPFVLSLLASSSLAVPASGMVPHVSNLAQLSSSLSALSAGPSSSLAAGYANLMQAIVPSPTPTAFSDLQSRVSAVASAHPSDPMAAAAALQLSGAAGNNLLSNGNPIIGNPNSDASDFGACNSFSNNNTQVPRRTIYPKASSTDAPYDVPESSMRSAIYFPSSYTNGQKLPVLLVHGTGVESCENFGPNVVKLLAPLFDPVFVNVPNYLLDDAQTSAEYVAYAVNYVSATTNHNVSVVTWSQGGIVAEWAFKYWPSTRSVTSDYVALSPDYHGTVLLPLLCPPGLPCAPSLLQQRYNSTFTNTLRGNGGPFAYVPTTEIHDTFDEIVQPEQDPNASSQINSNGAAPATNVQIQSVCSPGDPAYGPNLGHENPLFNPVSLAVVLDALQHPGPGNVARSGAARNCSQFVADGLGLTDVLTTEFVALPLAGLRIETASNKVFEEPAIKAYAASS